MSQNKNLSAVRNNALFKEVSDTNINFNFNPKDFIEIGEGEIIYQSGDSSDYVYLVIEGEIKLKIPGGSSSSFILRKSNNDFFGEKEVQENSVRKSSAVADKNSLLYIIRKIDLNSMTQRSKDLRYKLLGNINEDIKTEANKRETVFNGLIEKLPEQSFFKSDNNEPIEKTNHSEPKVIRDAEEETNNETELNYEAEPPGVSEIKNDSEVIYENEPEMKNPLNIESLGNNEEKLDIPIDEENKKSDPGQTNLPLTSLISAIQKIFSDLNPEEIFISISEAISGLLNVERVILYIIND